MPLPAAPALVLLALAVVPAAATQGGGFPDGAARTRGRGLDVDAEREVCNKIENCYCIKRTQCGWCEDTGKAMFGNNKGPLLDGETCQKWIAVPAKCPVLYCRGTDQEEIWWWVNTGWLPAVCFILLIAAMVHRKIVLAYTDPSEQVASVMNAVQFASGQASVTGSVSDEVAAMGPSLAQSEAADFFGTRRTFESFRKNMHCPASERLPTAVSRPYELNLADMSMRPGENYDKTRIAPIRLSSTISVALQGRSALGATLVNVTGMMFTCSLFVMFLRNAARSMNTREWQWVALFAKEVGAITMPLQTALGLLLSFYALNRIAWYWSVLMEGHALQGRLHDIGMIAGAVKKDTEKDWRVRYALYRHCTLTHFLAYQPYTPRLRFQGFQPLVNCGLVEPDEVEILAAAHRTPGAVVESWMSTWIELNLEGEIRQQAYMSLRELRGSIAKLQTTIAQRAPVSFESLLFVVVYAMVAILPFSLTPFLDTGNREALMDGPHVATVIGTGILVAFYLSLIHLLRHVQAPFDHIGAPNDALNAIALFNSTERKMRDYLSMPTVKEYAERIGQKPEQPRGAAAS